MEHPKISVIVPVYNRLDEVDELLQSLTKQTCGDFEVLVVEDGSSVPCKYVVEKYRTLLDVHYFNKPNSGPGQTRNFGAERSKGEYLLIFEFAQFENVTDHPVELFRRADDDIHIVFPLFGRDLSVLQCLCIAQNDRERRLHFMRHVGDEVVFEYLVSAQLARHRVEVVDENVDLILLAVFTLIFYLNGKIARSDFSRGGGDLSDGFTDHLPPDDADEYGENEAARAEIIYEHGDQRSELIEKGGVDEYRKHCKDIENAEQN